MDLSNNDNYLILQGCGGNLQEWVDGFTKLLRDEGIVNDSFSFDKVFSFKKDRIINLIFSLKGNINIEKLAIYRLKIRDVFGAMWLSDYCDIYLDKISI